MFSDDRLLQETASPPLKRRSWTSFKKTLPNSISAIEPATPKKKRSSVHLAFTFFPNHSAPPHHRKRRDSCASFTSRDGEGESDGGATDDEYLPSPSDFKARRTKSRHRRHTPYARPTNSGKGGLLVTPVRSSSRKARVSPPSRNKQSLADDANRIKEVVETSAIEDIDFQCPACGWIQANRRVPDFKRHVRTHLRKNDNEDKNGYWCKGVRVQDSSRYLLPTDAESYLFKDEARIGGCMRSFSRRDALKRHLDNPNITCVFDMLQE
ncbi:hypothetical protein BJ165DRAFT_1164201 [Panaeolus papilionaceus]|nr:hypothetical protein BJ165DRAFT_1164201 [Panaeolus papilionaceus]